MWAFIGLLSLLGIFVFLVLAVVSFFKRREKFKKNLMLAGGCFILTIAALSFDNTPAPTETAEVDADAVPASKDSKEVTKEKEEPKNEEKEEALKKEKQEKEKAAAEQAKKEEDEKLAAEQEKKLIEEESNQEKAAQFNFTWDQFQSNWSTLVPEIKEMGLATITVKDKVDQVDNQVVNAKINDYLMMMSDVDPASDKVKYIMLMAEPSANDQNQNLNILLAFGNLIASSNPDLTKDERGNILMDGLGFNGGSLENLNEHYEYEGVKYDASNMNGLLTLSIRPANK
ncbi:hypothetical protein MKZ02_21140 [Pseudobacillus sp. FSL P4-0506]|uniref:hypothetical protein n=1 Tax=Pseudobacillus sp. FSL P4-0506 TaxID=2921576 RepID=UPI0030F99356